MILGTQKIPECLDVARIRIRRHLETVFQDQTEHTYCDKSPSHHFGLLASGIGGGSVAAPPNSFFFGGGGGGFLPATPDEEEAVLLTSAPAPAALPPARLFSLFATPNFWFKPLAVCRPAATWSPCLSRKLLAVYAADRASDSETEEGSLRKLLAVFSAAFFCAQVVP